MLPLPEFLRYQVEPDYYNNTFPNLRLADAPLRDDSLPIELSYCIGFTDFRRTQLARTLETLARQTWRNFEVLIGDDGSTQDMESVYCLFRHHLRIKTVRLERQGFSGCPSKALKALYPLAEGKVISIAQPEFMLKPWACEFLYKAHFEKIPGANYYKINEPSIPARTGELITDEEYFHNRRWAALKPGFLARRQQTALDAIDWHVNVSNVEALPGFWTDAPGLSNQSNHYWYAFKPFPWWFCGSALATDSIWQDMNVTIGHAMIDLWLLNYRHLFSFVDIVPMEVGGYHQDHVRGSVSPVGEQDTVSVDNIRREHERKYLRKEG